MAIEAFSLAQNMHAIYSRLIAAIESIPSNELSKDKIYSITENSVKEMTELIGRLKENNANISR